MSAPALLVFFFGAVFFARHGFGFGADGAERALAVCEGLDEFWVSRSGSEPSPRGKERFGALHRRAAVFALGGDGVDSGSARATGGLLGLGFRGGAWARGRRCALTLCEGWVHARALRFLAWAEHPTVRLVRLRERLGGPEQRRQEHAERPKPASRAMRRGAGVGAGGHGVRGALGDGCSAAGL